MKTLFLARRRLISVLLMVLAAVVSGCAENTPESRVVFPNLMINGQPAQLVLETGAPASALSSAAAGRLGVKSTPLPRPVAGKIMEGANLISQGLSEPVNMTLGTETVTVQIPVDNSLTWELRGFIGDNREVDGVIGWPDVQDNILYFNGTRRVVSRLESLPEETASWTKLKIHPADKLLLETPSSNGTVGTILVDTASPLGVSLPPETWKDWRAKYPGTPWIDNSHVPPDYQISLGDIWHADDRLAREITIGSITLTSVPAHLAWPAEIAPFENYVGSLGLAALARMDLIVDGKGGFAYLRPIPFVEHAAAQNETPHPPLVKGDWTVDGSLHLKSEHLMAASGTLKSDSGDFEGALADFSRALAINPKSADIFLMRGQAKEKNGDEAGAIADLTQAIGLEPTNIQAYIDRGKARKNNDDLPGALADFNQALGIDQGNVAAFANRAEVKGIMGDDAGVIADLTHMLELEPEKVKRRNVADFNHVVNAYLSRASAEKNQGDLAAAVDDFTRAIKLIPKSPIGYEARAETRNAQGDFAGATTDFNQVLKLDSKYVDAYFGRAWDKTFTGDYPGALNDFDAGFKLDPQNPAYLLRGVAKESQGDFADALADYDKAMEVAPDNSWSAQLHRQLLRRRLGQPKEDFSKAVANFRNGWLKNIGEYLAGNLEESALLAAAAQPGRESVSSQQCDAYYYIGLTHLLNGDPDGARANWQKALATQATIDGEYLLAKAEITRLDRAKAK